MPLPTIPEKVKSYLWVVFLTAVGAAVQVAINKFGGAPAVIPQPPMEIQVRPIDSESGTVVVVRAPDGTMKATMFPKGAHSVISPESMFPESVLKDGK